SAQAFNERVCAHDRSLDRFARQIRIIAQGAIDRLSVLDPAKHGIYCHSCPSNDRGPTFNPGFPFSKWTTNLIKCAKSPDKCGFGCDCGGQEAQQWWVKGKKGLFGSRSMTLCGLTFKGHG